MQAYGSRLASIYERRWTRFAERAARKILDFFENAIQDSKSGLSETSLRSLLDICCGTGQLAQRFLKQGYRVVGLDASEFMLHYARRNAADFIAAGKARFLLGNAAAFNLSERFGLAVSTFDSLNHLENETELMGCFRSVRRVLEDEGMFLFDLNTRRGLERWNGITLEDAAGEWRLIHPGFYSAATGKGGSHISGIRFRTDGETESFEETVINTVFDLARVRELLQKSGWTRIHFARLDALDTPLDNPEEESRVCIVARA